MLGSRLLVSAFLIPAVIAALWFDVHLDGRTAQPVAPVLLFLCLGLCARGTWEMVDLLKTRSFDPSYLLCAACSTLIVVAAWAPRYVATDIKHPDELGPLAVAFAMAVLILFLAGAIRYREPGRSMETLGAELTTVSYVGVLLGVTAQLRFVGGPTTGCIALGSVIVAAKCGDIGAYTLGRLFGKRKMVPTLSPGKTWMGAWGALLGAIGGTFAWVQLSVTFFNKDWSPQPWYTAVVFGAVIGVVGLVGDLCESLIKRDVERKDSAALMPGFGGLLDLVDSILYAGPVAYVLWVAIPLAKAAE